MQLFSWVPPHLVRCGEANMLPAAPIFPLCSALVYRGWDRRIAIVVEELGEGAAALAGTLGRHRRTVRAGLALEVGQPCGDEVGGHRLGEIPALRGVAAVHRE